MVAAGTGDPGGIWRHYKSDLTGQKKVQFALTSAEEADGCHCEANLSYF